MRQRSKACSLDRWGMTKATWWGRAPTCRASRTPRRAPRRAIPPGHPRRRSRGRPSASGPHCGVSVQVGVGAAAPPARQPAGGGLYSGVLPFWRSNTPGLSLVREMPTVKPPRTCETSWPPHAGQTAFSSRSARLDEDLEALVAGGALEFVDGHGAIVRHRPAPSSPDPSLRGPVGATPGRCKLQACSPSRRPSSSSGPLARGVVRGLALQETATRHAPRRNRRARRPAAAGTGIRGRSEPLPAPRSPVSTSCDSPSGSRRSAHARSRPATRRAPCSRSACSSPGPTRRRVILEIWPHHDTELTSTTTINPGPWRSPAGERGDCERRSAGVCSAADWWLATFEATKRRVPGAHILREAHDPTSERSSCSSTCVPWSARRPPRRDPAPSRNCEMPRSAIASEHR